MPEEQEKTQQPTSRRRQKAREEGRVARSRELTSMLSMGGVLVIMLLMGDRIVEDLMALTREGLTISGSAAPRDVLLETTLRGMTIILPFLLFAASLAVFGSLIQGGLVLRPLRLQVEKLNPLEGVKRIISRYIVLELLKGVLKFGVSAVVLYLLLRKTIPSIMELMVMDVRGLSVTMTGMLLSTLKVGFLSFFIISIVDFINERLKHERSLRMSREEVKEEYKEAEGDPHVKSRIKSIQREMARRRMMQEVPKATVVITNPVHLAVALRYRRSEAGAPRVVAKGAGPVAEKIREVAARAGVPIVEDRPLAQALFKLEMGAEIPETLYRAVARILAYIYKLKGEAA